MVRGSKPFSRTSIFRLHSEPTSNPDIHCACTSLLIHHPSVEKRHKGEFTDRTVERPRTNIPIVALAMFFYLALLISYYIRNGSLKSTYIAPKKTSFLDLPSELRQQILEHACRDAVAMPSQPPKIKCHGYTSSYAQAVVVSVHEKSMGKFVDKCFAAICEIHRWARSIQRMDGVVGDVRAVERALIGRVRKMLNTFRETCARQGCPWIIGGINWWVLGCDVPRA